jgi:hypothetical protein
MRKLNKQILCVPLMDGDCHAISCFCLMPAVHTCPENFNMAIAGSPEMERKHGQIQ